MMHLLWPLQWPSESLFCEDLMERLSSYCPVALRVEASASTYPPSWIVEGPACAKSLVMSATQPFRLYSLVTALDTTLRHALTPRTSAISKVLTASSQLYLQNCSSPIEGSQFFPSSFQNLWNSQN